MSLRERVCSDFTPGGALEFEAVAPTWGTEGARARQPPTMTERSTMTNPSQAGRVRPIAAIILPLLIATAAPAQVTIDPFTAAQSGTGTLDTGTVVGGERDIREVSGATATVSGGTATCAGNFLTACVFVYDGNDSNAAVDTQPGFAPINFTTSGQDRLRIPTTLTMGSCNLSVQICDTVPNCNTQQGLISTGTATFLFSAFTGVSFTAVTFVSINLAPQSSPSTCSVGATATTPVELQELLAE